MKTYAMLVASFLALGAVSAAAEPLRPIVGGVLPPAEISSIVRSMGLMPTGRPVREGFTYAVVATDPRGRTLRVVIDARFGDVLMVRRVVAGAPGAPGPQPRDYGGPPARYVPYGAPWMRPDFRPPGMIGRADAYPSAAPGPRSRPAAPAGEKPEQKSAGVPAKPSAPVVTIGPSAAAQGDPEPTGSVAKVSSFPPVQPLE